MARDGKNKFYRKLKVDKETYRLLKLYRRFKKEMNKGK